MLNTKQVLGAFRKMPSIVKLQPSRRFVSSCRSHAGSDYIIQAALCPSIPASAVTQFAICLSGTSSLASRLLQSFCRNYSGFAWTECT